MPPRVRRLLRHADDSSSSQRRPPGIGGGSRIDFGTFPQGTTAVSGHGSQLVREHHRRCHCAQSGPPSTSTQYAEPKQFEPDTSRYRRTPLWSRRALSTVYDRHHWQRNLLPPAGRADQYPLLTGRRASARELEISGLLTASSSGIDDTCRWTVIVSSACSLPPVAQGGLVVTVSLPRNRPCWTTPVRWMGSWAASPQRSPTGCFPAFTICSSFRQLRVSVLPQPASRSRERERGRSLLVIIKLADRIRHIQTVAIEVRRAAVAADQC